MRRSPLPVRCALLGLLLIAVPSCTGAAATVDGEVAVGAGSGPHSAIAISERLEVVADERLPDVVDLSAAQARAALVHVGTQVQLVALGEEDRASAQYPAAGTPTPDDGVVIVWLGTPPVPPPARVGAATAGDLPAAAPAVAPDPELALQTGTEVPGAPALAVVDAPGGATPGGTTDGSAPGPTPSTDLTPGASPTPAVGTAPAPPSAAPPGRSDIRTMAPVATGTLLDGRASWYGPGFAGNTTACGGVFDPDGLTLATRELRCGTRVRITGPGGASVEATATDWGPAEWTNRRFDLSAATFRAIHHPDAGVITVRVEVLDSP